MMCRAPAIELGCGLTNSTASHDNDSNQNNTKKNEKWKSGEIKYAEDILKNIESTSIINRNHVFIICCLM